MGGGATAAENAVARDAMHLAVLRLEDGDDEIHEHENHVHRVAVDEQNLTEPLPRSDTKSLNLKGGIFEAAFNIPPF